MLNLLFQLVPFGFSITNFVLLLILMGKVGTNTKLTTTLETMTAQLHRIVNKLGA